jgi:Calcineurin-like phosphoesterase
MSRPPGRRRRTSAAARSTPQSDALSILRTAQEQVTSRSTATLLSSDARQWVSQYLRHLLDGRRPFPTYGPGESGMFPMPDIAHVALASDWGTGTDSAYRVADVMATRRPDITIPLGDVYYTGAMAEFEDFFLPANCWPRGTHATYALNGNHEMYSGGHGYFDHALPQLGQRTSYFCLHNAHWRIVALDTGYHTTRGPGLLFGDDTRLHDAILQWLETVVFANPSDRRPVILLSHHQWFSAFDTREYAAVGQALIPYLPHVALWFWGHEHRFVGYAPYAPAGAPIRARCIGHGGMPVELNNHLVRPSRHAVFIDERKAATLDGDDIGFCGFASLRFDGPTLTVDYIDEQDRVLLTEHWTHTAGGLRGSVTLHTTDPAFRLIGPIDQLL